MADANGGGSFDEWIDDADDMGLPCEIEPLGGHVEREAKDDAGEC